MSLLTSRTLLPLDLNKGYLMILLLDALDNRKLHLKQQLLFAY